jgi:phage baseplate assembly protein V
MTNWHREGRDGLLGSIRRASVVEIDDSGTQQFLKKGKGLKSEQFEQVYRPQPFGMTSNPPAGSEGLLLAMGGRSDRLLGLGFEHKDYRPKDTEIGGTIIYDANGSAVSLVKPNLRIVHAQKLVLAAPVIVLESGDIRLGGESANRPVSAQGTVTSDGATDTSNFLGAVKGQ